MRSFAVWGASPDIIGVHCGTPAPHAIMFWASWYPGQSQDVTGYAFVEVPGFARVGNNVGFRLFKRPLKGSGVAVRSRVVRGEPGV